MKKVRLFTLGLLGLLFVEQTMAMRHFPGEDFPFPLTTLVEGQPPPLYLFDLPIVPDTEPLADSVFGRVSTWLASMGPATRFTRVEALKLELSEEILTRFAGAIAYQLSLSRYFGFPVQVEVPVASVEHAMQRGHFSAFDSALNLYSLSGTSRVTHPFLWASFDQSVANALGIEGNPSILDPYTLFTRDPILGQQILLLRYIGVGEEYCVSWALAHTLAAGGDRNSVGRVLSPVEGRLGSLAVETYATFPTLIMVDGSIVPADRRVLFLLKRSPHSEVACVQLATVFTVVWEESKIVNIFSQRLTPSEFVIFCQQKLENAFFPEEEEGEDPTIARMVQAQEARYDTFDALQQEIDNAPSSHRRSILLRAWYGQCLLSRDGLSLGKFMELAVKNDVFEILQDVGSLIRDGLLSKGTVNFRECGLNNPFVWPLTAKKARAVELLCDLFPEFTLEAWRISYRRDGNGGVAFDYDGDEISGWSSFKTTLPGLAVLKESLIGRLNGSSTPIPPYLQKLCRTYKMAGGQFFCSDRKGFLSPAVMAVLSTRSDFLRWMLDDNTNPENLTGTTYNFSRPEFEIHLESGENGWYRRKPLTLLDYTLKCPSGDPREFVCCALMLEHLLSLGVPYAEILPHITYQSSQRATQAGLPRLIIAGEKSQKEFMKLCECDKPALSDLVQNGYAPLFLLGLPMRPWEKLDLKSFTDFRNTTPKRPEMAERFKLMKCVLEESYKGEKIADDVMTSNDLRVHTMLLDRCIAACSPAPAVAASVAAVPAPPAAK
ncbi:MAG: hypothetical protein LBJ70_00965 [Holosporales bacterium]|jgi:hypothetical protein|nr:hypothetical protein [Holosporales bacterium]